MNDIRLIASDLDATLLTSGGELPPGFRDDIRRLREAGILFVAASGRPLPTLKKMFPPQEGIAYISDNGAAISLHDEVLYTSLLSRDTYQEMAAFTLARTPGIPVVCGLDAGYLLAEHADHSGFIGRFFTELVFVDRAEDVDIDANKFSVYFPDGDSRQPCENLYRPAYGREYSVTIGGPVWVDIMNAGVHKGSALALLADHLGLDATQMMAFGDTDNDLELLDAVHYSYAVSNADVAVRERARFLTASNDEYGVAQVIRQVLAG